MCIRDSFISLEILSLAILYPLANDKGKKEEIENGQTQGVQDIKVEYPQLIVSPPISVNKYPIYKVNLCLLLSLIIPTEAIQNDFVPSPAISRW
mgnify:CR=1 FL=1